MITSVFFFFSVRDGADKCKANRVECAKLLAFLNNQVQSIIEIDKLPVVHLTIFQHSLNDIPPAFVHLQL